MNFKPLETDSEYRAGLAIRNALIDYAPMSYEESKERDRLRPTDREYCRWIGLVDGDIASRTYLVETNDPETRTYHAMPTVKNGVDAATHIESSATFLLREASQRRAKVVISEMRSDRPEMLETLHRLGFQTSQLNPMSCVDLHLSKPAGFNASEVEFTTLRELFEASGEPAYRKFWAMHMAIQRDIPSPVPFVETSYEEFRQELTDAFLDHSCLHIAMVDGEPIGVSEFAQNQVDGRHGITYLTGVLREHRRRGIARALKLKAFDSARQKGIRWLWTDNEVDNPMYALNLQLGFQKQFDWHLLTLRL